MFNFDEFVDGYIEAMLWADCEPYIPSKRDDLQRAYAEWSGPNPDASVEEMQTYLYGRLERGGCEGLDVSDETRQYVITHGQLKEFVESYPELIAAYCVIRQSSTPDSASAYFGHDLYLTRAHHGTGFWDRGLGELGDKLTDAAHAAGSVDDHVLTDDGNGNAVPNY